jgi:uncharacterized membrane protein YdbT with pleckstrin-like domain
MNTPEPASETATPVEQTVWQGTPSQVINLPQYLVWGLAFIVFAGGAIFVAISMEPASSLVISVLLMLALAALGIAAWKWLVIANTQYELTTQRLRTHTGVLNKHLDELELYRVRDYKLEQPFFLRLFSLWTLILQTSDKSNPVLVLRAIPRGDTLREYMRTHVEEARMRRGVREIDLDHP